MEKGQRYLYPNPGGLPLLFLVSQVLHPPHFTRNLLFLPEGNVNISAQYISLSASLSKGKYRIRGGEMSI